MQLQAKLRVALKFGRVRWRTHAQQRMLERGILRSDVCAIIEQGRIIEGYLGDRPYPSFLIYGLASERPLHVLVAHSESDNMLYVITAYEPDDANFESDHITRRSK